jgi:hypothetical protein
MNWHALAVALLISVCMWLALVGMVLGIAR